MSRRTPIINILKAVYIFELYPASVVFKLNRKSKSNTTSKIYFSLRRKSKN